MADGHKKDLPPLQFAALAAELLKSADTLVPAWLPGGVRRGHEYVCGSLAGGKGSSCSVNLTTGAWADFSSDERGGDLLSLYAAIHGLTMAKACVELARAEGLESVCVGSSAHSRCTHISSGNSDFRCYPRNHQWTSSLLF